MAKKPKPTSDPLTVPEEQIAHDLWVYQGWTKLRIAQHFGRTYQVIIGLVRRHNDWCKEAVEYRKRLTADAKARAERITRLELGIIETDLQAHNIAAQKSLQAVAEMSPARALKARRFLPSLRELHPIGRTDTGRPVTVSGDGRGDDRSKSILERLLERAGQGAVPTAPFPGDEEQQEAAPPPKDDDDGGKDEP